MNAVDTSTYKVNHFYDTLGFVGSFGYNNSDSAWGANLFISQNNEYLTDVGFWAVSVAGGSMLYTIRVYDHFKGGVFSNLLETTSGTCANFGYYTIALPSKLYSAKGDTLGIVVNFKTPGYDYPIPCCYPVSDYSSKARNSSGRSYTSSTGTSFSDITKSTRNALVCIRALCVSAPATQASNIQFGNVQQTQMDVSFTNGSSCKQAAFMMQGTAGAVSPVNLTTYTANPLFGSGSQVGTSGWYCVFNGTGSNFSVSNLAPNTTYRVMVCAYNGYAGAEVYNITSGTGNPANQTTLPPIPGTPTLSLPPNGASGISLSPTLAWNAGSGATSYCLQVATASNFLSGIVYDDSMLVGTSQAIGPLSHKRSVFLACGR